MPARVQTERPRGFGEFHPRLFRRTAALAVVARVAARHKIFPTALAGPRSRYDVVKREFVRVERPMAILAGVAIAHQNVLA